MKAPTYWIGCRPFTQGDRFLQRGSGERLVFESMSLGNKRPTALFRRLDQPGFYSYPAKAVTLRKALIRDRGPFTVRIANKKPPRMSYTELDAIWNREWNRPEVWTPDGWFKNGHPCRPPERKPKTKRIRRRVRRKIKRRRKTK